MEKKDQGIKVKTSPEFKLKDYPKHRRFVSIDLKKQFGFQPEVIIIEKIEGSSRLILRAVLTPEEMEKEEKLKKNQSK